VVTIYHMQVVRCRVPGQELAAEKYAKRKGSDESEQIAV
jgi:hypothetical protein